MAVKKKGGLGKGLDALIQNKNPEESQAPAAEKESGDATTLMSIDKIEPNRDQPRKMFDEDKLEELADSIKQHGVLQPLLVMKKDDYFMIIAGERRWRASKKAGLTEVPVVISKPLTDQEILEIGLIENLQREDINPIEEALGYKRLLEEFNMKQDDVAERVSKRRAAIANSIRLLKLDGRVQDMIINESISTGHARAILAITDPDKQFDFAQRIFDEKMSVREVEKEIKRLQNEKSSTKEKGPKVDPQLTVVYGDVAEKLKRTLGTKVSINAKDDNQGKIEIEYYSRDELNRIVDLLETIQK